MKWFLGIDGGGTTTRAVAVSATGQIWGEGEAGPSNYHNVGIDAALANVLGASKQARQRAGVRTAPVAVFLGCAGIKSAADTALMKSMAETSGIGPTGGIVVANDLHNALTGGLAGRAGIALIAGTGTNCLGRDASGESFMCGGWGWLLDDVGGGFGLGMAALRAVARATDGRAGRTSLEAAVLAFYGLSEPYELLARLHVGKWTPDELAGLAPVVVRNAESGDAVAQSILREGASALAELVAGTARRLSFSKGPEVVILGGCARSGPPYQPLVEAAIGRVCPRARLVEPEYSPAHGSALNALRAGHISPLPKLQIPKHHA